MSIYRGILEQTPVGPLHILSEDNYIIRLDFSNTITDDIDNFLTKIYGKWEITPGANPEILKAMVQLEEYFAGSRKTFDINVKLYGTEFYTKVWEQLCKIPYGEVISYQELAARVGREKAYRAVGQANHHNPISIIIPCHRVIGKNKKLTGYGGGINNKKTLLKLEGINIK